MMLPSISILRIWHPCMIFLPSFDNDGILAKIIFNRTWKKTQAVAIFHRYFRSSVWMTKNWKKYSWNIFSYFEQKLKFTYPGLHKRRPRYRRNLQLSKENIQHFTKWNLLTFFYMCGSFSPFCPSGTATLFFGKILSRFWRFFPKQRTYECYEIN